VANSVRWYNDIWARRPEVRSGLFGRVVIGSARRGTLLNSRPPLLADDLAASLVLTPDERVIVPGARVIVRTPRTASDLLRRRVRAIVTVSQVEQAEGAPARPHGPGRRTCGDVRHALSPYRPDRPDRVVYLGAVKGRLCAERWALATRNHAAGGQAQARRAGSWPTTRSGRRSGSQRRQPARLRAAPADHHARPSSRRIVTIS
jgi:hypothetical protein